MLDIQSIARALGGDVKGRDQALVPGPGHSPKDRSLSITLADNHDGFVCHSFAQDDAIICKDYVRSRLGLPAFRPNGHAKKAGPEIDISSSLNGVDWLRQFNKKAAEQQQSYNGKIVTAFDYKDAGGNLLYQNCKLEPKDFRQRTPDGTWSLASLNGRRVLYRLPELLSFPDATVFVTEGEKDADNVIKLGYCATTVASHKWTDECLQALAGRDCWIIEDNDAPGLKMANEAAKKLHGIAKSVRIVSLPGLGPRLPRNGKDISDWLDQGHTGAELEEICYSTPLWDPAKAPILPPSSENAAEDAAGIGLVSDLRNAPEVKGNGAALNDEIDEEIAPAGSEESLALHFAERHTDELRYVAPWSKWMLWNGTCWEDDETLKAFNMARRLCRAAANASNKKGSVIASAKTIRAVEGLAKADRRLAATIDQWDADPWLLNTPAGVIDLRDGVTRPHRHDYYMSKITTVAAADCVTPHWLSFLDRVCGGDVELVAFLQRVAGYALTGITREHALFFLYGIGSNGKTTFINATTGALGDYCRNAPIETFTATQSERHPTDLAGLRGARLVTAVETEEGRRWAESKIKALTGGDKISARFMRQDFFEYVPQFKLLIAGNHRPGLRSVDEAIRRRMNLIPFTVTIPVAERDPELSAKLATESAGILRWMVNGCLQWQRRGLAPPAVVTAATAAYLEAEDAMAAWISDSCDIDPRHWESGANLFASWTAWANKSGEFVGPLKRFVERLENRPGTEPKRANNIRGFCGLRIRDAAYTAW